jgi:hypothetical protein
VEPLNRLLLAFRVFGKTIADKAFATTVEPLLSSRSSQIDLRILALLQRDGQLVDFLMEDIEGYGDAQIGAAVRKIHQDARSALRSHLSLEPVLSGEDGSAVEVPAGFDPAAVRLVGNVVGSPPFRGVIRHRGWKVTSVRLPNLPATRDVETAVIAPAEVELP